MADTNEKVMAMVEEEIKKDSSIDTATLYDKAKKVDKSIGKLTVRQFNARYPLQVKRKMAPARKSKRRARSRRTAKAADGGRDAVRSVMLDYARRLAAAESKADIVDLVAGVDKFVDRVLKAAKSG